MNRYFYDKKCKSKGYLIKEDNKWKLVHCFKYKFIFCFCFSSFSFHYPDLHNWPKPVQKFVISRPVILLMANSFCKDNTESLLYGLVTVLGSNKKMKWFLCGVDRWKIFNGSQWTINLDNLIFNWNYVFDIYNHKITFSQNESSFFNPGMHNNSSKILFNVRTNLIELLLITFEPIFSSSSLISVSFSPFYTSNSC